MLGVILFTIFIGLVYFWNQYAFRHWSRHGFKQLSPVFFFGDSFGLLTLKSSMGEFFQGVYQKYKKDKMVGVYISYNSVLVVTDPKVFVGKID